MQARKGSVEIRQKIMGTVAVAPHSFRPPGSGQHLDLGFQDLVHGGLRSISPGWIEDSVLNSLPSAVQDGIRDWHKGGWTPMGRLGTPADVGNAVALLCSDEANWITGQLIDVDGGASLMDAHLPLEIQQAVPRVAKAA